MSRLVSIQRVVLAYRRQLRQASSPRMQVRQNALPINRPKGMDRDVVKENGTLKTQGADIVKPKSTDIQPKDVFPATPNHVGVYSLAESGKDRSKAVDRQVEKDKGHDVVNNLSQYLISTKGNGVEGTEEGTK